MVDWLVALKALAKNANLFFDGQAHMLYRQYDNNTARVLSPYTAEQVAKSTALVLKHYEYALNSTVIQEDLSFYVLLEKRQKEVKQFSSLSQKGLEHYITELNKLEDVFLWWECVAHPDLESLWT